MKRQVIRRYRGSSVAKTKDSRVGLILNIVRSVAHVQIVVAIERDAPCDALPSIHSSRPSVGA